MKSDQIQLLFCVLFLYTGASCKILPIAVNLSFSTNGFNSNKDIAIGSGLSHQYQIDLHSIKYQVHYNLSCRHKAQGIRNCSLHWGAKRTSPRLLCTLTNIKVCHLPHLKYCTIAAMIVGQNGNRSSSSKPMHQYLYHSVPPLPVRHLKAENISSTEVKLIWIRPDCHSMPYIYTVEVLHYRHRAKEVTLHYVPVVAQFCKYDVKGLEPFTSYNICVSTQSKLRLDGSSDKMCIPVRMHEGVPTKGPQILNVVPTHSSADVSQAIIYWKVPPLTSLKGKVRAYEIFYADKKDLNEWKRTRVPLQDQKSGHFNYTLSNLFTSKEYTVKVRLVTGGGFVDSQFENISFRKRKLAKSGGITTKTWVILIVITLLAIIALITIIVLYWRYKKCRKRKSRSPGQSTKTSMLKDIDEILPTPYYTVKSDKQPNADEASSLYACITHPSQLETSKTNQSGI